MQFVAIDNLLLSSLQLIDVPIDRNVPSRQIFALLLS